MGGSQELEDGSWLVEKMVPKGTSFIPGDQVQIEMDSQDIEKLYEPLVSMANTY